MAGERIGYTDCASNLLDGVLLVGYPPFVPCFALHLALSCCANLIRGLGEGELVG